MLRGGIGVGKKSISGKVCIGSDYKELEGKFKEGDILVSEFTDRDMIE